MKLEHDYLIETAVNLYGARLFDNDGSLCSQEVAEMVVDALDGGDKALRRKLLLAILDRDAETSDDDVGLIDIDDIA